MIMEKKIISFMLDCSRNAVPNKSFLKKWIDILADCGYSSAREILRKVLRDMKLPFWMFYPFIKLGARIFGGFSLESNSPMEAVKRSQIPMIFVHGDHDDFVPCEMSEQLYKSCASEIKDLHIVKDAGHGLAFPVERDAYIASLAEFEKVWRK